MDLSIDFEDLAGVVKIEDEHKKVVESWRSEIGCELAPCFENGEFLKLFLEKVKPEEQLKFVKTTSEHFCGKQNLDPRYILVFRRAIVGDKPKPEVFWTTEFGIALNGLAQEIPKNSPQRHYSEICVSTKRILDMCPAADDEEMETERTYGAGSSDGEIRISSKPMSLTSMSLFTYKPEEEKKALIEYQNSENMITKEEVLRRIEESKNGSSSRKHIVEEKCLIDEMEFM